MTKKPAAKPRKLTAKAKAAPNPRANLGKIRRLAMKYDAAQTTTDNSRHWTNADELSADAAADASTRRTLRIRGRYEQANNPYVDGMLQTLAADIIGTGPRLQMLAGAESVNRKIEAEFHEWADEIGLAEKLRTAVEAVAASGEVFLMLGYNGGLEHPVKLDVQLIEADQVATPDLSLATGDPNRTDGIVYDRWGNPSEYHVLYSHPGSTTFYDLQAVDYYRVPASQMVHLFKPRRPGQRRGVPRITSSLPLSADRRNYRQSVLTAAKVAAEMGAIVLETQGMGDSDQADDDAFDSVEIERGMMTFLPNGRKASQLKPEQPGVNYQAFDDKLINETARPLNMPFNIAACNSSQYNYASGRLDHQTYDRSIDVEHADLERKCLRRILARWMAEATRIPSLLPFRTPAVLGGKLPHAWLWRGREHVDPTKEADAQTSRLKNFTTLLEDEWAREGLDAETQWTKLQRQIERMESLGISFDKPAAQPAAEPEPDADDEPDEEPDEPKTATGRNGNGRFH